MNLSKYLLVLTTLLPLFEAIYAQEQETNLSATEVLKQKNIEEQFNYIIKKSGRYQEYKVVKQVWFDQLKINTLDTIKSLEISLINTNKQIADQNKTISNLQESLAKTNENLTTITNEKDNMFFLGMPITKSNYKTTMWAIIGGLLTLLGFFIFKFKNSNTQTVQAKKTLAETEAEFEDHRRRSLEREQKVMRKLQDEINKQRKVGSK